MRTIVVWKLELLGVFLTPFVGLRENHSGMELLIYSRAAVLFALRENHSGMETPFQSRIHHERRFRCVRTIVVWKHTRECHTRISISMLRENHSGMLRAVVGGSWLVVGQEPKNQKEERNHKAEENQVV